MKVDCHSKAKKREKKEEEKKGGDSVNTAMVGEESTFTTMFKGDTLML